MSSTLSGSNLFTSIDVTDLTTVSQKLDDGSIYGEERDANGQTFLMAACAQGNTEVVKKLLENDVEINAVDYDDWSALHYASKDGHLDCVVTLLDHGANIEQRDVGGWTALMWACYKGYTEMVRVLLEKGANIHVKGEHHMSCIIWAAGRGHEEIVKLLLEKGAKVNTTDKYGTSPLVWAARKGYLEIVYMLLERGANVDIAGMYSWTPLIVAAKHGFVEVVRAILDYNPNINSVDKDGFTALTCAVKAGHVEVVEDLLEKGAYVNITDKDGDSILIHAVKSGDYQIVQTLLRKYADIDVHGSDNKTALYHAVEKGYLDIAKSILTYSPDLELTNKDGDTPLMRAVRTRNTEMVDLLLNKGAKVSATDKKGDTALHLALRGRCRKVTELLLRNPKNSRLLYRPNKNGETPYTIDSNHQKSILTQIYGARNLNANEANENLLGYDLYSSTIADVLSEPTLCTPITVGLYAKWGSGKSFLLDKLKTEMQLFEHQTVDRTLQYTPLLFTFCTMISLLLGVIVGLLSGWPGGLGLGAGLLFFFFSFIGLIWFGTNRKDWDTAYKISVYLGTKFGNLKLLLQVIFCNPKEVSKDTSLVRYLFTGYTKLTTFSGEQSIAMMVATLAEEVEREIGSVTARLFRVFKPQKNSNNRKYRSLCCIPNFVFVIFVFLCIVACIILVALFPIMPTTTTVTDPNTSKDDDDDDDDDDDHTHSHTHPIWPFPPVYGAMIALGIVIGFAFIGNIYTWWQMIAAVAKPQRKRVMEAMKYMKSSKVEKFIHTLKDEVAVLSTMVQSLNSFTGNQYRFVVFVDGLDSSEQEKLLQVLDMVNILFSELESPFVIILAVDPHIIIKGIEQNLPSLFRDSNINGHDYLRNIVHFPVFLQNQGLPIQRLLRQQAHHNHHNESHSIGNHTTRESPPKRQESVLSSTSLDKVARTRKRKERSDRLISFTGSTSNYFASATDLSKTLVKNDYFSDMNPRSMRRLMNIVAITARLLRAYSIDYGWHRLATWVNITEQWPYRTSWIIWYFEDNEDLDDGIALKEIYDRVVPRIPLTREVEPLLEIDRNIKKFEEFLASNNPALTVADIKRFLPCCINIDPFLRKRIREYMKQYEQLPAEFQVNPAFTRLGVSESSSSLGQLEGRPPNPAVFTPNIRPTLSNISPPFFPQLHPQHPAMMTPTGAPMMRMPYIIPTQHHPSMNGTSVSVMGGTKKVYLKGGVPKHHLSSMSLDDVCQLLMKLEGLSPAAVQKYQEEIFQNNINGFVLYNCDMDELKPVLGMNFGDWQLFKAMILALRSREEEMLSGVPSSDRYMNNYLALSSENLEKMCQEESHRATPAGKFDSDQSRLSHDSTIDSGVGCVEAQDLDTKYDVLDSSRVSVVNSKDFYKKSGKLFRKNSIAQQIQMESMLLNDVIDEFSEGGSDGEDESTDLESPINFAVGDDEVDSRVSTPEAKSEESRDNHRAETPPSFKVSSHRSSLRKPENSHAATSPCGNSKVQFSIPEKGESIEMDSIACEIKSGESSPDNLNQSADEVKLLKQKDGLRLSSPISSVDDIHRSVKAALWKKKSKSKRVKSPELSPDHSDGGEAVSEPLISKKQRKKEQKEKKGSKEGGRPEFFMEPMNTVETGRKTEVDVQVHRTLMNAAAYTSGYEHGASESMKPSGSSSKISSQGSSRNPSRTASVESVKTAPDESRRSSARSSAQSSRDSSPNSIHSGRHKKFSVTEVKIDMPIGSNPEAV